jgi:hypothetical protein
VANGEAGRWIQNGELERPPLADGRCHEGQSLPMELPSRSEFHVEAGHLFHSY